MNGLEPVVDVVTERGYRIQGTTKHRIKVVDDSASWVWRRFADLRPGDRVPLALGQLDRRAAGGRPPAARRTRWAGPASTTSRCRARCRPSWPSWSATSWATARCTPAGLRLCVAEADFDVVEHLERLGQGAVRPPGRRRPQQRLHRGGAALRAPRRVVAGLRLRQAPPAEGHRARATRRTSRTPCCTPTTVTSTPPSSAGCSRPTARSPAATRRGRRPSSVVPDDVQALLLALGYVTTVPSTTQRPGFAAARAPAAEPCLEPAAGSTRSASCRGRKNGAGRRSATVAAGGAPRPPPGHPRAHRPGRSRQRPSPQGRC